MRIPRLDADQASIAVFGYIRIEDDVRFVQHGIPDSHP